MKQRLWKLFGYGSTVLLGVAALFPQVFRLPRDLYSWVFLAAIAWFFLFITGFFSR
jgi:hypothetical protein